MSRRLAWGAVAVGLYLLGAVAIRSDLPFRPLYDGGTPSAPYRWVNPPPEFAEGNRPPAGATATIDLGQDGSVAQSVLTEDTQAQISFPDGAFADRGEARAVRVEIDPVGLMGLPQLPRGLVADGNAYRFSAVYPPEGGPAPLQETVGVVLRYPRHATAVLRLDGDRWTRLATTRIAASLVVVGDTPRLGVFVAAVPPELIDQQAQGIPPILLAVVTAAAALLGAGFGYRARRRLAAERAEAVRRAAKRSTPAKRDTPPAKRKTRSRKRKRRR